MLKEGPKSAARVHRMGRMGFCEALPVCCSQSTAWIRVEFLPVEFLIAKISVEFYQLIPMEYNISKLWINPPMISIMIICLKDSSAWEDMYVQVSILKEWPSDLNEHNFEDNFMDILLNDNI